jgi:hypothetical protein
MNNILKKMRMQKIYKKMWKDKNHAKRYKDYISSIALIYNDEEPCCFSEMKSFIVSAM